MRGRPEKTICDAYPPIHTIRPPRIPENSIRYSKTHGRGCRSDGARNPDSGFGIRRYDDVNFDVNFIVNNRHPVF